MLPESSERIIFSFRQYYPYNDSKGYRRRMATGDSFATFTPIRTTEGEIPFLTRSHEGYLAVNVKNQDDCKRFFNSCSR